MTVWCQTNSEWATFEDSYSVKLSQHSQKSEAMNTYTNQPQAASEKDTCMLIKGSLIVSSLHKFTQQTCFYTGN